MPRPPISPATYSAYVPDPSTASPGMVKRAKRVLARAKAILEDKGWVQRTSTGPNGEMCLSAAISEARTVRSKPGLIPLGSGKFDKVLAGLLEQARPKVTRRARPFYMLDSVVDWNDKPTRTKDQVLALLDAAVAEEPVAVSM